MKFKVTLLLEFALLLSAAAQETRFFRVAGPVASTITAFNADGYVTWTNEVTNTTFTVQTAVSLVGPSNLVDYIQVPVTNPATTHRLFDPRPPADMAFIPAGSFTMGDNLDDDLCGGATKTGILLSSSHFDLGLERVKRGRVGKGGGRCAVTSCSPRCHTFVTCTFGAVRAFLGP
jgi:hypothetical protein